MTSRPSIGRPIRNRLRMLAMLSVLCLPTVVRSDSSSRGQSNPDERHNPIVPNAPVMVADVFVQGNRVVPAKQITAQIRTRRGMKVDEECLRGDVRTLMGTRRFSKVEVVSRPTHDGRIHVFFLVREHPVKHAEDETSLMRVGPIFVIGNTKTRMDVILRQVPLFPGAVLDVEDLRKAEQNLVRTNRFVVDSRKGIRPRVCVLDNPNDPKSEFKDIVVIVEEKESTHFFHVMCDELDEWGYLLDVRTRVLIPAAFVHYLYDTCCR